MKKVFLLILFLCCVTAVTAYAANGDIAGHIYSTDIRAYINDIEVPSYNIGGRTVVVVEDVTEDYSYNDDLRTLLVGGFGPWNLKAGSAEYSFVPGMIVGDVYETDIKTYVCDKEITAYALDGKTAVAIEDLGGDQTWSELGGKYKWDPDARKVSLETVCGSDEIRRCLGDMNIKITLNSGKTEAEAEFYFDKFSIGGSVTVENEPDGSEITAPVYAGINGERKQIGMYIAGNTLYFDVVGYDMGNGEIRYGGDVTGGRPVYKLAKFPYSKWMLDAEFVEKGVASVTSEELTPADKVIREYILYHACTLTERFDSENGTFAYMSGSTPHGSIDVLLLIRQDGSCRDYSEDFKSVSLWSTKRFDNVRIDRETEKVYFRYDTDYVIDIKTGALEKVS